MAGEKEAEIENGWVNWWMDGWMDGWMDRMNE
jgi:hypothetical protein